MLEQSTGDMASGSVVGSHQQTRLSFGLTGLMILTVLVPLLAVAPTVEATGTRHVYTFSDGNTEAVALATPGAAANTIKVALPKGAEVTDAQVTLSGASSTGWNQLVTNTRAGWMAGESNDADPRSDELSLGMYSPVESFETLGMDAEPSTASAWLDNGSFAIRQPHTSNATESRFSQQRTVSTSGGGTYSGGVFQYRGWLFSSDLQSSNVAGMIRMLHPNNGTQVQGSQYNNGIVHLDTSNCQIPSKPYTWAGYGIKDWAVTDDERVFGLLTSYYQSTSAQYHRIIEFDIRYLTDWTCVATYDISSNNHGDFTAISYDRTRDIVWANHHLLKRVIQYDFHGDGTFTRNSTDYYTYFSSSGQVRGMVAHGTWFYFRTYASWNSDRLEAYAITGEPGSTLTQQTGSVTISANGYGITYDGKRLCSMDYYSWSGSKLYREFGSSWTYPISPQPGTSVWLSPATETGSTLVAANVEVAWSATAAGDRVDHWVSADNGTHWVPVSNNETIHFQHPGTQLRWKVQLVGSTAVSWWNLIEYANGYESVGDWSSPAAATGTEVGRVRAAWQADEPSGTSIAVHISADNGTNWQAVQNDVEVQIDNSSWAGAGNLLRYRVLMNSSSTTVTPKLQSFVLHYEEGWPSGVRLDIGGDGSDEFTHSGVLTDPQIATGNALVDALNAHSIQNGVGDAEIPFTIKVGSSGRVRLQGLDITYMMQTRALDASIDGGTIVPDGSYRTLIARVAEGDQASRLSTVELAFETTRGRSPSIRWSSGDVCNTVADPDGLLGFDAGNCSSQTIDGITSLRLPIRPTWDWDDESDIEVGFRVDDDIGRSVTDWKTTDLDLEVENDIVLSDMSVVDETGRQLMNSDWMRGGMNVTMSGSISFEGTSFTPRPGEFSLEVTGVNLTRDGEPMGDPISFVSEQNPAYGQYSLTFQTPIESTPGGMLFRVKAVNLPNGSNFANPDVNSVRIVLDGNSPLVISATPLDGEEKHAGAQPISIVVQDSVDPPIEITLHFWIENQSDLNYNGLPEEDEYQTMALRSPEVRAGGINIFNGILDDSWNRHQERVSLYVSGEDTSGNAVAMGGGSVCPPQPEFCGDGPSMTPPDWDADLTTYWVREEFQPSLDADNSTIIGHDDETPLHPGTSYIARLRIDDGNGWDDVQTVHLALAGDFNDPAQSIYANFTRNGPNDVSMNLESGGTGLAVSNLYSSFGPAPSDSNALVLDIRFQLTWWFPEVFDTDGTTTFVPAIEVTDRPCRLAESEPCHEDRGGLGFDEWSLDNDLRFDLEEGHLTAIDLATGRNLYDPGGDPALIAAGQVIRIEGRILFSEDSTPAPGGACDIVVGDYEMSWSAVPRSDGHFTLDLLVPNVRSGHLDASMTLERLPGLAQDSTSSNPRLQLEVDGIAPAIDSIAPIGDVQIRDSSSLSVNLFTKDGSGFSEDHPAVLHYRVRAGTSEISRGSQPLSDLTQIYTDAMWSGTLDLTDAGVSQLLPGYLVDVWFTGADKAGNPYDSTNNSESQPYATWRLIRTGPEVDLRVAEIVWSDPSPSGGEKIQLTVTGENLAVHEGDLTFALVEEVEPGVWADVSGAISNATLMPSAPYAIAIELETEVVDEPVVRRFRLAARDGHIDIDVITLEALTIEPYQARDAEALGAQIQESSLVFLLYLAAMAFAGFAVTMLVMYRKLLHGEDESDPVEQTLIVEEEMATPAPPPGFDSTTAAGVGKARGAAPPPAGFDPNAGASTAPPPVVTHAATTTTDPSAAAIAPPVAPAGHSQPAALQWSDEQLIGQGWTQVQIYQWRQQQAQHAYGAGATSADVTGVAAPATHSDKVVDHVMRKHGLTDRAAFLAAAEFFDSDGNRYLTVQELEAAAAALSGEGSA